MKIARCETYQESSGYWKWKAIGVRGDIIACSKNHFKTLRDCEDDMVKFKKEQGKIPPKVNKPQSLFKTLLRKIMFW